MARTLMFLMLVTVSIVRPAQATVYELEGQVTNGTSLFPRGENGPGIPYGGFGLPAGGYPVDFVARLEVGARQTNWSFDFVVTDNEQSIGYAVKGPILPEPRESRGYRNILVRTLKKSPLISFTSHSWANPLS